MMRERKSNSLEARYAALQSSKRCLEMLCETRRLEIRSLLSHLRACTDENAESIARWKALKKARKFLATYSSPAEEMDAR